MCRCNLEYTSDGARDILDPYSWERTVVTQQPQASMKTPRPARVDEPASAVCFRPVEGVRYA